MPEASVELVEGALGQEGYGAGGARRFRQAVYETIDRVEQAPRRGPRVRNAPKVGDREMRKVRVKGYDERWWVIYHLDGDAPWIMSISHSSLIPDGRLLPPLIIDANVAGSVVG